LMKELAIERINLLKLDCEGAEWDILPAAEEVLPKIQQICMEFHSMQGWTPEKLAVWLSEPGYKVRHTSGSWNGLLWAYRSQPAEPGSTAAKTEQDTGNDTILVHGGNTPRV